VQSMALPQGFPVGGTAVSARATQAQRDAAFERLFDEFSAPIFNYVLRMVADRDRLADEGSRRSWLYRIATNTAIDEMRRRRFTTPMGNDERHLQRPDAGPGPEAQAIAGTLDERVQRALLRLKANHRQCLLLSDVEDMSAHQIGEVMGLSYGAVRTLLCRARGEMRRHLAAEGFTR